MSKPTYYLWKNDFSTEEAFIKAKEKFTNLGFRVVTFNDRKKEKDLREGIRAVIQNHCNG